MDVSTKMKCNENLKKEIKGLSKIWYIPTTDYLQSIRGGNLFHVSIDDVEKINFYFMFKSIICEIFWKIIHPYFCEGKVVQI